MTKLDLDAIRTLAAADWSCLGAAQITAHTWALREYAVQLCDALDAADAWEETCAAAQQALVDLIAFVAHGEGNGYVALAAAQAAAERNAPGRALRAQLAAAERLAAAAREQLQLLHARGTPLLADLVHALEAYDATAGASDATA